jgi:polysaccharide biosynthesis/export protein
MGHRMIVRLFFVPLAVLLAPTASALAAPQAPAPARPEEPKLEYLIGPGDVLQVFVWKEPELSKDVTVRMDGKISVPLLGDMDAAGRSPRQLGAELASAFGRFLSSPQVTLGVSQANSTRFYVLGKVAKPGEFPLTGKVSVLQGLALAGGLLEFAKPESIVVIRQAPQGGQTAIPFNYKRIEEAKDITQNFLLRPGDTIIVP